MHSAFKTPLQRRDRKNGRKASVPVPVIEDSYDSESGQVFTETVFRGRQHTDWIGEYKTPNIVQKARPNHSGARSLFDIAKSKCVKESRNFTPEHFENIPWSIAEQVWTEIVATHSESFLTWRTLASVYNEHGELGQPAYRYHIEVRQPVLSTREYYSGLTAPNKEWLLALRISPRELPVPELVAVANITNLAVLDLSDGQHILENRVAHFDERVMRSWAEMASSRKAFSRLRVLLLGWQDLVSDWIFKYLHSFPSLCLIITTDCKAMNQKNRSDWEPTANLHGWEAQHAKKSVKTLRPLLDDGSFYTAAVSSCYYQSFKLEGTEDVDAQSRIRPVVECRLGMPRSWTHIIDEFPGTRTIWLEKKMTSYQVAESQSKRVREVLNASQSSVSPPSKRTQGKMGAKRKATEHSATSLLSEFGLG